MMAQTSTVARFLFPLSLEVERDREHGPTQEDRLGRLAKCERRLETVNMAYPAIVRETFGYLEDQLRERIDLAGTMRSVAPILN